MTKFEELILKFDEDLSKKDIIYVKKISEDLFNELLIITHCPSVELELTLDDENYLYKFNKKKIVINLQTIKYFQKFSHLFLLDTIFSIIRTLMQMNFKNTVKEREELNGNFYTVKNNDKLPFDYKDIFRLDDVILLYCALEKDKEDFHSLSMFDRRVFVFRCMENYLNYVNYENKNEYINYLKEDFVLCREDERPETPQVLEDKIISKYKLENKIGFLEELELREIIYKRISKILGEY